MGLLSIHKELLRSSRWLSDDVLDVEWLGGDVHVLPSLSIVPSELNLFSFFSQFRCHNESSMVSDIINVVSGVRRCPGDTTITRNVQIFSFLIS